MRYKIFCKNKVIEQGRFILTELGIFEKFWKMGELCPKNQIPWNSENRVYTSEKLSNGYETPKIGFCLKNWPRDMCIVPILSVEAEI